MEDYYDDEDEFEPEQPQDLGIVRIGGTTYICNRKAYEQMLKYINLEDKAMLDVVLLVGKASREIRVPTTEQLEELKEALKKRGDYDGRLFGE